MTKNGRGMDRYDDKEKRLIRRKNHIARDLRTPKFRQRIVELEKTKEDKYKYDYTRDDDYYGYDRGDEPFRHNDEPTDSGDIHLADEQQD